MSIIEPYCERSEVNANAEGRALVPWLAFGMPSINQ